MQDPRELVDKIRREENDLSAKLLNLEYFMMTEDFIKISAEQKQLLEQQHKVMTEYKLILIKRAHRINWEASRDKAAAEIKEAMEKDESGIDPERCKTCANAPVHWSTCHDCVRGSNYQAAEIKETTERLEPHVFAAMEYEAWKKKEEERLKTKGDNLPDCATCKWAEEGIGKLRYRCKNPNKVVQRDRCWEEKEDGTPSDK